MANAARGQTSQPDTGSIPPSSSSCAPHHPQRTGIEQNSQRRPPFAHRAVYWPNIQAVYFCPKKKNRRWTRRRKWGPRRVEPSSKPKRLF
ncbi:hypothetical protein HOLleu_04712 [Holothuria leucospilota]|uniref:Uncharacterized protein n=1 Tax=Holothuria leucospilota TaxID=206669 RepID=A0A9Q1HGX8_HOLLE|nr:hypothetical protein HOLleu_04712 [Holothuria leucospilota]